MKMKIVLMVSVLLNVVLAALLVVRNKPAPDLTTGTHATPITNTSAPAVTQTQNEPAASGGIAPARFDWRMVESDDYRKYIANLRAIGCPEETIRDIIVADVNKLFESRRKELNAGGKKFEYWKTGNPFATLIDADKLERQQKLAQEKREVLKELLGAAPEEKPDLFAGMNPFEAMLDFLPAEKQSKVMQLIQDWQVKMMKKMKGGPPDAVDTKEMLNAQKEMEAELATILSPQEMEDYQLRLSPTASTLRMQLAGFDPSEQEFRDIFKLAKAYDDQFKPMARSTDKTEREQAETARKEMEAQIKTLLGDARYAEYKRAQDWTYKGIAKVAERNGLAKDAAVKVYDMKNIAEEQAQKVRGDKSLNKEQRHAALRGIRAETENSIRTVFGDKAFASYQQQDSAFWLKNISPDPKNTARISETSDSPNIKAVTQF